jgi:hypothetical protein
MRYKEHIMTPYVFQRGETISLALDAVSGDPLSVTAIDAAMKAVLPGRTSIHAGAPVAAAFVITPRPATGSIPPGWTLTIPALVSAALGAGSYLADARLEMAGGVIVTETVALRIKETVTL